ncbi:MAG: hypothetical protein ACU0BK_09160 [Shimia sp.]|uniref:hypothetical protein n=1 Tax=Shimia sp. TaxID=1954381 RepID=UPI004058E9FF
MLRLMPFCPRPVEWVFLCIGAIFIAVSMHWTFNLQTLVMGLDGQHRNSLEAIKIQSAFQKNSYQEVSFAGQKWAVTEANQQAYCFQMKVFKPIGDWYASTPTIVKGEDGRNTAVLQRSTHGVEEAAEAARFITSAVFSISVLGLLLVNLKKPNPTVSLVRYLQAVALFVVFLGTLQSFGFFAVLSPTEYGKFAIPVGEYHFVSTAQWSFAWLFAQASIISALFWVIPMLFIGADKVRVVVASLLMWILSTPIFVVISAIDQIAC